MADLKDGALLFSLGACLERERERFALSQAEAELRRAIEHRERVEGEKMRLVEELSRERVRALARTEERRRLQDEARALVRQRLAEVERANEEAKARAELEILALKKAHERRLIEIQLATARSRNRMIAALLVLIFTASAATSGLLYFGPWQPKTQQTKLLLEQLRAERTRAQEAERLSRAAQRRYADLVACLRRDDCFGVGAQKTDVERVHRDAMAQSATPPLGSGSDSVSK